jgi:hypothetical protein
MTSCSTPSFKASSASTRSIPLAIAWSLSARLNLYSEQDSRTNSMLAALCYRVGFEYRQVRAMQTTNYNPEGYGWPTRAIWRTRAGTTGS